MLPALSSLDPKCSHTSLDRQEERGTIFLLTDPKKLWGCLKEEVA